MKLQQLFSDFIHLLSPRNQMQSAFLETEVTGLFFDTQKSIKDSVFFAVPGLKSDGHQFIPQAIDKGAIALVVENELNVPESFSGLVYIVPSSREALDLIAAKFYEFPSDKLFCIGVTGTNGKTSITYILEHIFNIGSSFR